MNKYLKPEVLAQLKNLSLVAKLVVEGFLSGSHQSRRLGTGMEFSQYRNYQPGDDLRQLDWKLLARSDRYYIKQSETPKNRNIRFIIDASASMNYQEEGVSKLEYARFIAASLAYLSEQQGDAIGLYTYNQKECQQLPPQVKSDQLRRFFYLLEQTQAQGKWTSSEALNYIYPSSNRRECVVLVTDFYEDQSEILEVLKRFSGAKHEVLVFHLLGEKERLLDFKGLILFEDLETGQTIEVDTKSVKASYQEVLKQHHQEIEQALLQQNIYWNLTNINEPLEAVLRSFLSRI